VARKIKNLFFMSDMKILLVLSQRKEYNGRDKITSMHMIKLGVRSRSRGR
jgi:hypothetical protein